jgi:osmotically-inducible protein OsmY
MNKIPSFLRPVFAAAMFAGGIAACAVSPPRTEAQRAIDASTAAAVEDALRLDPRIYARHVDVSVRDGVAHLTGFVWTPMEMYYAKSDAVKVPGVRWVSDELEMPRGGMSGTSR